ncbi:MAG: GMC family oxidoreductase, partial [Microcoleus sp. SIO2G3]|nr:GMC family oxidoreductase [Microcoleus sp. SIO2G3]
CDELLPYYQRAQAAFGMGQFAYEAEDWEDAEHPRLPFVGDAVTTRVFQFSAGKVFFEQYREMLRRSPNITAYLHATVADSKQKKQARVVCPDGKQFWVATRFFVLAVGERSPHRNH